MWTLKSKSVRRLTKEEVVQAQLPIGRLLQMELSLVFTDGTNDVAVSTFVSTKDEAKAAIKQNLARLNEQAELDTEIANDTLDLSKPAVPEKTKAERDQEAWVKDWGNLQKVQPLIDAGVLTGDEAPVINLRNRVKNDFKAAYLDLI